MDKKISLPEAIIMILMVGGVDILEIATDLAQAIPVIGQILAVAEWFVDIFILAIIQFWLIMKGGIGFRKQAVALAGNLIEMIPLLDILPIRTATLLATIYLINKPEIAEKIEAVKSKPTKI